MIMIQLRQQWSRRLAPLALVLLVIGLLPGVPAQAVGVIDQPLDDTQSDFVRGSFLGTAVGPNHRRDILPDDFDGAIQLTPVGVLNPWPISGLLPQGLANHGIAVVGNRLFTIAGGIAGGSTNAVYGVRIDKRNATFLGHGLADGNPRIVNNNWTNDPLPAVQGSFYANCTGPETLRARTNVAVASLDNGDGTGYIYVVGGNARLSPCGESGGTPSAMSVPTVQIGTVAANGSISWTSGSELANAYLPSPLLANDNDNPDSILVGQKVGIESSQLVVARTPAGKTFLYLLGGASIHPNNNFDVELGRRALTTPAVFYTEINRATGRFRHPLTGATNEPWARTRNIPVIPPAGFDQTATYGLHNHVATVARTVSGSGVNAVFRDAIFVAGGYAAAISPIPTSLRRDAFNAYVYRATINPDTGALSWDRTPTRSGTTQENIDPPGAFVAMEGNPAAAMAGMAFNNKLYLIAGTTTADNTSALNSVITGAYDGDFQFQSLLGPTDFFVGRNQTLPVLPRRLTGPAAATMVAAAAADDQNATAAWAFVVGGQTETGQISDAIYAGRVGGSGETIESSVRMRDGWYYSRYVDVSLERTGQQNSAARVLKIRWGTEIDRSSNSQADIQLDFRYVRRADLRCDESAFPESVPWLPLDGDTASPFRSANLSVERPLNDVELAGLFDGEDFNATCIQYRARFIQNGLTEGGTPLPAIDPSATPRLLGISLQKTLPGLPDLRLINQDDFVVQVNEGAFANLVLKVTNLNIEGLDQTLSADNFTGGQVHVLLCMSYDADAMPADPTFPDLPWIEEGRVPCAPVYGLLNRSALGPGASVTLTRTSDWFRNDPNDPNPLDEPFGDLGELFRESGFYKVGIVIDPLNLIEEGTVGESNNLAQFEGQPLIRAFEITREPPPPPPPDDDRVFLPLIGR